AADREADAVAGRNHDGGRPDLDVELYHLALLERLRAVMAVVGAIGSGELPVELAVRGAQPALADRGMRVDGALEHHLLEVAGEYAQHDEEIGVAGRGRHEQLERRRPRDLGLLRERLAEEGDAVAHGLEASHRLARRALAGKRAGRGVEMELRPARALERPLVFGTLDEPVDVTHLQQHARLL